MGGVCADGEWATENVPEGFKFSSGVLASAGALNSAAKAASEAHKFLLLRFVKKRNR